MPQLTRIRIERAYGENLESVWIITINGLQWGGERDASGAGNATFTTAEEARGALLDSGINEDVEVDE